MTLLGALGLGFGALSLVAGLAQGIVQDKEMKEEIKNEVKAEYDRRESKGEEAQ